MSYREKATMTVLDAWAKCNKLKIPEIEVVKRMAQGEKLEVEYSSITDYGEAWSRLWLGTQEIGYWIGY